jgi:hypothetical protein
MLTILSHAVFWPALLWNLFFWAIVLFNLDSISLKDDLIDCFMSLLFVLVPGIYLFGVW